MENKTEEKDKTKEMQGSTTLPAIITDRSIRSIDELRCILEQRDKFIAEYLKKGIDFGKIPGTKKAALYEPGAEKLCALFTLAPEFKTLDKKEEFNQDIPFLFYRYKCVLRRIGTGEKVAEAVGSCNSLEAQYRYRWVPENKLPAGSDVNTLVSREVEGDYGKYIQYRLINEDIAELMDTIDAKAQKRAYVRATRIATQTSARFVQEEYTPKNGSYGSKTKPQSKPSAKNEPKKTPKAGKISLATKSAILLALKHASLTDEEKKWISTKVDLENPKHVTDKDLFSEVGGQRTLKYIELREKQAKIRERLLTCFKGDEEAALVFTKVILKIPIVDLNKLIPEQLEKLQKAIEEREKGISPLAMASPKLPLDQKSAAAGPEKDDDEVPF